MTLGSGPYEEGPEPNVIHPLNIPVLDHVPICTDLCPISLDHDLSHKVRGQYRTIGYRRHLRIRYVDDIFQF